MEIRFTQLEFAYNELTHECEEEKYSTKENEEISRGFSFPSVPLPSPLHEGFLTFRRNGEIYSAHFLFSSAKKSVFKNLSRRLNEKFKEKWSQMDKDGIGYILEEGEPYMSISSGCRGNGRIIAIGSSGAKPLEVRSFEDFGMHLTSLEKMINIYVECCLSPLIKSSKIPPLQEHPIYISA